MIAKFAYNNKKTLLIVFGLLGIFLVGYFWKRKTDSQKALGDLKVDNSQLQITNNQAIVISENLLAAMNKYGTDEKTILDNLAPLQKDDLLLVMKTFGVKPYNGAGLATRDYEKMFFAQDLNLIGWLKAELNDKDLADVKAIFETQNIPF